MWLKSNEVHTWHSSAVNMCNAQEGARAISLPLTLHGTIGYNRTFLDMERQETKPFFVSSNCTKKKAALPKKKSLIAPASDHTIHTAR